MGWAMIDPPLTGVLDLLDGVLLRVKSECQGVSNIGTSDAAAIRWGTKFSMGYSRHLIAPIHQPFDCFRQGTERAAKMAGVFPRMAAVRQLNPLNRAQIRF